MPVLAGVMEWPYLQAIRDAFIGFALPMIIVGSMFLILSFPPVPQGTSVRWLAAMAGWADRYRPVLMVPFQMSFGLMAFLVSFGVAYNLAVAYRLPEPAHAGLVAGAALFIVSVPVGVSAAGISTVPLGVFLQGLGGEGLFVGIVLALWTGETFRWFRQRGLILRLPEGVPPKVIRSFESIVPAFVVLLGAWALEWFVSTHFTVQLAVGGQSGGGAGTPARTPATLPLWVTQALGPLVRASNSYPSALLQIVLMMLLWSVGIHGMNMVSAVAYPFWTTALQANVAAASAGQPLPYIVTEPFYHMYAHLGGVRCHAAVGVHDAAFARPTAAAGGESRAAAGDL